MSTDPRIEIATRAVVSAEHSMHTNESLGKQRNIARFVLAALDKAATITTVEELDALPEGAVVLGWAFNGSTPYLRCLTLHGRLVWGCVGQADLFTSADLLKDGFKARVIHWGTE